MGTAWLFDYDVLGNYNTFRLLNGLFDEKMALFKLKRGNQDI